MLKVDCPIYSSESFFPRFKISHFLKFHTSSIGRETPYCEPISYELIGAIEANRVSIRSRELKFTDTFRGECSFIAREYRTGNTYIGMRGNCQLVIVQETEIEFKFMDLPSRPICCTLACDDKTLILGMSKREVRIFSLEDPSNPFLVSTVSLNALVTNVLLMDSQ